MEKEQLAKLTFDPTDDVGVRAYRPASLGQERKFGAEITPP